MQPMSSCLTVPCLCLLDGCIVCNLLFPFVPFPLPVRVDPSSLTVVVRRCPSLRRLSGGRCSALLFFFFCSTPFRANQTYEQQSNTAAARTRRGVTRVGGSMGSVKEGTAAIPSSTVTASSALCSLRRISSGPSLSDRPTHRPLRLFSLPP